MPPTAGSPPPTTSNMHGGPLLPSAQAHYSPPGSYQAGSPPGSYMAGSYPRPDMGSYPIGQRPGTEATLAGGVRPDSVPRMGSLQTVPNLHPPDTVQGLHHDH